MSRVPRFRKKQRQSTPVRCVLRSAGALLVVTNWNNSGNVRLFFGSDASALTASQLAQIQFANPGGFAPGRYPAQLLSTGELVPVPRPTLQMARTGSALVLTWPGNYQLLSATNVLGPYNRFQGPLRLLRMTCAPTTSGSSYYTANKIRTGRRAM